MPGCRMRGVRAPVISQPTAPTAAVVLARARAIEERMPHEEAVQARRKLWLQAYSTAFPSTENPISEAGHWGLSSGASTAIRTTPGLAFGTQTGGGAFDDSITYLSGFRPNQRARIKIHKAGSLTGSGFREVEILLHAGGTHWYECNLAFDGQYQDVVRMINPGGNVTGTDFKFLNATPGSGGPGSVNDGDIFEAEWINGTINTYINGSLFNSVTDPNGSPYLTGSPGYGCFISGSGITNSDYCAASFVAWELGL